MINDLTEKQPSAMKRLFQGQKWPATAPFSILHHAFIFLPVPYAYATSLQSRAWKRLLQAVPGKRSRKREEVIVGLFMKNGGRISITAVEKRRNKLRNWPRKPHNVFFSAKKAVEVEQAK